MIPRIITTPETKVLFSQFLLKILINDSLVRRALMSEVQTDRGLIFIQ